MAQAVDGAEVVFTWDLAAGLPQVLGTSDGTLDVYGLARIGEQRAGQWTYALGDALGSVRQWVDDGGHVTYAAGYAPYGELQWSSGSTASAWGFTGEWWDAAVNLEYLRARWYDSGTGRFASPDKEPPDTGNPQNIHAYVYVLSNRGLFTDPSGLCAATGSGGVCARPGIDARDLTDWLYRELVTNAQNPAILRLRAMSALGYGVGIGAVGCTAGWIAGQPTIMAGSAAMALGGAIAHGTALYQFSQLVKNGAVWDVKDEIGLKLGPGVTLCPAGGCDNDIEYSVSGNVLFAYLGGAAGIFGVEVQAGAGYAEITDPAHTAGGAEYGGPYVPPDIREMVGATPWDPTTWNFGDDPLDHEAVTLGIRLWGKYGAAMTRGQFESELGGYDGKLARCEPNPGPVRAEVARDWPYRVGYYNNIGRVYVLEKGRCP